MPSKPSSIRFLLDEHYPPWLARELTAAGWDTSAVACEPHLRGADDAEVLRVATAERRVVVTEDVFTFTAAILAVPDHVGVVYCHHARFPRTKPGLRRLSRALTRLAAVPPEGLGSAPIIWWLEAP